MSPLIQIFHHRERSPRLGRKSFDSDPDILAGFCGPWHVRSAILPRLEGRFRRYPVWTPLALELTILGYLLLVICGNSLKPLSAPVSKSPAQAVAVALPKHAPHTDVIPPAPNQRPAVPPEPIRFNANIPLLPDPPDNWDGAALKE